MAGQVALAAMLLIGVAAREVLHDGPACVGAELIALAIIEIVDGLDQRHVAVGDQLEDALRLGRVPLGN